MRGHNSIPHLSPLSWYIHNILVSNVQYCLLLLLLLLLLYLAVCCVCTAFVIYTVWSLSGLLLFEIVGHHRHMKQQEPPRTVLYCTYNQCALGAHTFIIDVFFFFQLVFFPMKKKSANVSCLSLSLLQAHTHTHTHTQLFIVGPMGSFYITHGFFLSFFLCWLYTR